MSKEIKHVPRKKRKLIRTKVDKTPPVKNLKDLIELGQSSKFYKNIDMVMLWNIVPYLEEMNSLIGMEKLKDSIFNQIIYYIQGMHTKNKSDEYLHTMFFGPPGVGKTTVVRIIANIYISMGILSKKGPFVTAHRDDFIAGYLGQTAIKTHKLLQSCLGGVLFIDEVYALAPRKKENDSFSKEAIDTICSFLSEHTNDFCFIGAGYEEEVYNCFFNMNSGLESRFQWKHTIENYSNGELADIFFKKVKEIKWDFNINKSFLTDIISKNQEYFTNYGRDVVNLITKCKIAHAKRVICLDKEHRFILTEKDIENGIEIVKKTKIKTKQSSEAPQNMYT